MILMSPWVVPVSTGYIEDGAVVVEAGRIMEVGSAGLICSRYPSHSVKHFHDAVLMPGFVNVHTHLELSILRGYLEGMDFWKWIRELTRTKYEVLAPDDILVSALLGAIESIRAGITTVGDPMDLGGSLEAVLSTGLRAVLYQEVFSPRPEEADDAAGRLEANLHRRRQQIDTYPAGSRLSQFMAPPPSLLGDSHTEDRKKRVRLGVSPHSLYTVSAPLFLAVDCIASAAGLPVCIHVGESQLERHFLLDGTGSIADSYRARGIQWVPPQTTPIQYLGNLGILKESTLLVHCVQLEAEDFATLQAHKTAVAHCPKSNWKLGHGFMNLREMRQRAVRLGLGTDSVASNNAMDMFEEMRFTSSNPSLCAQPGIASSNQDGYPWVTSSDLLRIATLGGAEALGLSKEIGSIEEGKRADIIAVDFSGFHVQPVFSPVDALVFSCRASDIRMTMVGGEILYEDGVIPGFLPGEFSRAVAEIRTKLQNARRQN
jgi:cytosine/adenosine deaminase-related metal-dependent hydrolase